MSVDHKTWPPDMYVARLAEALWEEAARRYAARGADFTDPVRIRRSDEETTKLNLAAVRRALIKAGDIRMEADAHGMKWVRMGFDVRVDAKIVICCGCGLPVNQNNPRCHVMAPDAYMGTYGPCCSPYNVSDDELREKCKQARSEANAARDGVDALRNRLAAVWRALDGEATT